MGKLSKTPLYSNNLKKLKTTLKPEHFKILNSTKGFYNVRKKYYQSRNCSCKQSKCLQLYCECFSAGIYCKPTCKCE